MRAPVQLTASSSGRASRTGGIAPHFVDSLDSVQLVQDAAQLSHINDLDRDVDGDLTVVMGSSVRVEDVDALIGEKGGNVLEESDPVVGADAACGRASCTSRTSWARPRNTASARWEGTLAMGS